MAVDGGVSSFRIGMVVVTKNPKSYQSNSLVASSFANSGGIGSLVDTGWNDA